MGHPGRVTSPPPPDAGPRPWDAAWHEALYGPDGFYRRSAPAAHFATSVQGIPGGGALLAEAVLALARRNACTRVVDVGCGRGELLAHLRRLAPDLHLTGVDVVVRPHGLDVDDWLVSPGGAALPPGLRDLTDTLVLAHEWLDVVPCPLVRRDDDGVWRTLTVTTHGTEALGPPVAGEQLAWAQRWLPLGIVRAEVGLPRDLALVDLLRRMTRGVVVVVDYGHTRETRPAYGTLTGYRDGREVAPVPDGSRDLTAHLAVDSLMTAALEHTEGCDLAPQREVLGELLGDPTTPVSHATARREPTAYLQALARRSALATLTAPGGLGDFWWVVAIVGRGA